MLARNQIQLMMATPQEVKTMDDKSLLSIFQPEGKQSFYSPALLGPSTIAACATSTETMQAIRAVLDKLDPDDYVDYLKLYFDEGRQRFGPHWKLLEIMNVLYASAMLIQPRRYMEIGVRRGRSLAMVLAACPDVEAVGFDMWMENYAGMENPGPAFVQQEMQKISSAAKIQLIDGNSHETVPQFLAANPDAMFDLITVDGDHSEKGALQDLRDVLPRLSVGGAIVFDDISHPAHPYLIKTWRKAVAEDGCLAPYEFTELGYGIAFAMRQYSPQSEQIKRKSLRGRLFG
jgi:predicted O-methyltransferase YrrM